ncbi:hypothetical protein HYH02_005584 [Chlamydomonas schloesseri]|uniref:Uncharacterized protein n=1 Tax=Chlamydomonas schloesseri TaxID=2026947 RepID=A0A836B6Y4_9CHLO|nr:hypothetical protein HYH02_005584 [Chlamydomonas schloesseri]|eukprot:KAG2449437.1 hypothetical protein HYH02_005584 [Chlamydomonas schloesseri]
MGPLRQLLADGDDIGLSAYVEALWARRHENSAFGLAEAEDAVWVLANSAERPALQQGVWPHLLGLLTRWAYMQSRGAGYRAAEGPDVDAKSSQLVGTLCSLLAGPLAARPPQAWAVRAPALLLIAVVGSAAQGTGRTPGAGLGPSAAGAPSRGPAAELQLRTLACKAICEALMRSPRRSAGSTPAVATPAAGAYLASTWPAAAPASVAAAAASAVASSALVGVSGSSGTDATLLLPTAAAVTDLCTAAQVVLEMLAADGDSRLFLALQSALMDTLAWELGGLVWRAAAAAAGAGPGALGVAAAAAPAAGVAAAQEAAAAALAALHAALRQLAGACVRSAAADSRAAGTGPVLAMLAVAAEQLRATAAATITAAAAVGSPEGLRAKAGLSLAQALAAAAAGGLLEGMLATVRLQPPVSQAPLLRALQPATDRLVATLLGAAGAAAVTTVIPAGVSGAAAVADMAASALRQAVGYCWARLRLQPGLQASELAPVPGVVAERMAEAAALAAAAVDSAWHPARGALEVLFCGALGVGRIVAAAIEGAPPPAVYEALASHSQSPLYGDMQPLARGALEALAAARQQATAAAGAATTPGGGATAATAAGQLATGILHDTVAAARRLHVLYGAVADSGRGAAWLAALPPPASGLLRELIDRACVCVVSAASGAFGALAAPAVAVASAAAASTLQRTAFASAQGPPHPAADTAVGSAATAAVAALGALADVQFCGLQLRAHGDLVGMLSAAVAAAPRAAAAPLLALLPCYPAFASAYAAGSEGGSGNGVALSRLTFLLPFATSCVPHAGDVGGAAAVVLPFVYLLLKGGGVSSAGGAGGEAVCQVAHAVWAALLAALCGDAEGGGQREDPRRFKTPTAEHGAIVEVGTGVEVAASMAPYYMQRSCQQPCGPGDVELMQRGLLQAFRSLPVNHPVKAWCVVRLAQQLSEWGAVAEPEVAAAAAAAAATAAAAPRRMLRMGPAAGPGTAALPLPPRVALVQACGIALAVLMTGLDFALLPRGFDALDSLLLSRAEGGGAHASAGSSGAPNRGAGAVVRPLPPACRTAVLQLLHDVWLRCDDHARKPLLDGWLHGAVGALPPPHNRGTVMDAAQDSGSVISAGPPRLRVLLRD